MINRRFSVKKKLGEGRSAVYLCGDNEQSRKNIALKVLSANTTAEEKKIFKDEFETIQKLDHPNIIQAFERGTIVELSENETLVPGSKYLAIEFFDGKELLDYAIRDEAALKIIIAQISSVLFYLHQSRFIYYDLKPENILVKEIDGRPFIKLIDLGFARQRNNGAENIKTGTAEYIAPEILKHQPHDHRVDLYSFGMLLYRLIYKKFPFESDDHLKIYKSHIEQEFIYPETEYSTELLHVIKKLLSKNPDERYFTSVQVLYDMNIPISEDLYANWAPVKIFTDRTDILNIVHGYVKTRATGEAINIRGFERSGKTAVMNELYSRYDNSIQIPNDRTKSGSEFVKFFLTKLIFNDIVFEKLPPEAIVLMNKILNNQSENLSSDLKLLVNKITSSCKVILLLDDFNIYDKFAQEIFSEIIPVFQVNGSSIILTEKSDLDFVSGFISNSVHLDLTSFTSVQVDELLASLYADFFPLEEAKQLIVLYADFLPGNIVEFLKDLVLLGIIRFEYDAVRIHTDENIENVLANLHEDIYGIRCKSLSKEELKLASLISSFEVVPKKNLLTKLIGFTPEHFSRVVENLQRKHIFQPQSQSGLNFTSDGIRNFIYSRISDKKSYHQNIAEQILEKFPDFNKVELARHFQICEWYDSSYSLLISEVEAAEKISALKYARDILEQLLKLPLQESQKLNIKIKLAFLYDVLNDFKNANTFSGELVEANLSNDLLTEMQILYGNSLIRLGEIESGKKILTSMIPAVLDENKKLKLMLDIAGAELDMNNFEAAEKICREIIDDSRAAHEHKGDAYNLLGLIAINRSNDLDMALENFQLCLSESSKTNSPQRIAGIEGNIGNIYNIRGDFENVEKHWNKSLEISSSLGNYYHQAQVLLNFGIYHFSRNNFDEAIKNYTKASLIFSTLGDNSGLGRSDSNLGELYLFICDYNNASRSLLNARDKFQTIQNSIEESEALFLLGKLYHKLGDLRKLKETIIELEEISKENNSLTRLSSHINFLKSLYDFESGKELNDKLLHDTFQDYLENEDRLNFTESVSLWAEFFLDKKDFAKVAEVLTNKEAESIYKSNVYLEAERLYLIGRVSSKVSSLGLENCTSYYDRAINLISDVSVTELTWKILLETSLSYLERGNILKAKEYAEYGRSLIYFFADKFSMAMQKDMYINFSQRHLALEKFTEIINSTNN